MPQDSRGRYAPSDEDSPLADLASAARATSTNSSAFDTTNIDSINATLIVTATTGTDETLDVSLQTTADGTNWYAVGSFAQQTATTAGVAKVFGPLGDSCRWAWTIGGTDTPGFTFSIASTVDRDD